jgi:hypothetical protein
MDRTTAGHRSRGEPVQPLPATSRSPRSSRIVLEESATAVNEIELAGSPTLCVLPQENRQEIVFLYRFQPKLLSHDIGCRIRYKSIPVRYKPSRDRHIEKWL